MFQITCEAVSLQSATESESFTLSNFSSGRVGFSRHPQINIYVENKSRSSCVVPRAGNNRYQSGKVLGFSFCSNEKSRDARRSACSREEQAESLSTAQIMWQDEFLCFFYPFLPSRCSFFCLPFFFFLLLFSSASEETFRPSFRFDFLLRLSLSRVSQLVCIFSYHGRYHTPSWWYLSMFHFRWPSVFPLFSLLPQHTTKVCLVCDHGPDFGNRLCDKHCQLQPLVGAMIYRLTYV